MLVCLVLLNVGLFYCDCCLLVILLAVVYVCFGCFFDFDLCIVFELVVFVLWWS